MGSASQPPARSKVPEVTLDFWLIKIAATTLGETGGDAVTMTLDLGYLVGTLIFSCRVDRSFERLAVWHEQTGDYDTEIHAGRLDASGEPLDPVPVLVGGAGARYDQVAFNGTDFVVTWGTPRLLPSPASRPRG